MAVIRLQSRLKIANNQLCMRSRWHGCCIILQKSCKLRTSQLGFPCFLPERHQDGHQQHLPPLKHEGDIYTCRSWIFRLIKFSFSSKLILLKKLSQSVRNFTRIRNRAAIKSLSLYISLPHHYLINGLKCQKRSLHKFPEPKLTSSSYYFCPTESPKPYEKWLLINSL